METQLQAGELPTTGQTSQEKESYTKQEYQAAIIKTKSDVLAEAGRTIASLTSERDSLKSASAELEEAKQALEEINEQLKDNPDGIALVAALKKAIAREKVAVAKDTEATDRLAKAQVIEDMEKRDTLIIELAEKYMTAAGEDVDPVAFHKAANRFDITKPDQAKLEAIAEEKGWKLKIEPATSESGEPLVSGKTSGGGLTTEEARLKARYPTMK